MTAQRYERIPAWTRGDRLRKARQLTGLNTRDFAEEIGVSQKTVNNAESDSHEVRKIVLNAWSLATGVPVEWLENGEEPTQGPPPPGEDGHNAALAELTQRKRGRAATTTTRGTTTRRYLAAA